jgi:uncharacterized protein (TIGR03000 family)
MYSAILMVALTTAPASQGFCFRGAACHGCFGGCHAARSGCHAVRSGCHGCHRCHGGYGTHYGSQWYGYSGYGHGLGGYGCYAGCFGCFCYGGAAGSGGFYGGAGSYLGCHGCHSASIGGCHGGHACHGHGGCHASCHGSVAPIEPAPPSQPYETDRVPGRVPEKVPPPREEKQEQARARVRIDVPADAKVFIDGQLMQSTATPRVFQTPDLKPGQLYFYDLRAEVVREGQVVSETQRVILRPGGEAVASFANLGQASATASARATE